MAETADDLPARETLETDVVIVGAGPAGLATAIRLKQVAPDLGVVVLEKGSEVGAHILSGAVMDPAGLDALLPEWRTDETLARTPVTSDAFYWLGPSGEIRLPMALFPPFLSNEGCFVVSLANVCRWMAGQAEALGVEIFPGFAGAELLTDASGTVTGVATGDMGVAKDGHRKPSFQRGMALSARYTVIAEGARGSLAKQLIRRFDLDKDRSPQKFGIGLKELWRVRPQVHRPGAVLHTMGWPLDNDTGGGSFLYHLDDHQVAVGLVVHLDYSNPTLSPFDEFQRFKHHPLIAQVLEGGRRLAFGARAIAEGGYQSVPKLAFPGGVLVGCAAGLVNVPRIKGSHNAILSGMLAAEHLAAAVAAGRAHDTLEDFEAAWRSGPVGRDLSRVRNVKPLWSRLGTLGGLALGGAELWCQQLVSASPFGTLKHKKPDFACLKPLKAVRPIAYPKPDGVLSFDRTASVYVSNTNHEEDQPAHLRLKDPAVPITHNLPAYGEPARLYCPVGVYEVVYGDPQTKQAPRFVINAQNCIHCKTCDIKDPSQNIDWVPPEGGGGPNYPNM